ncbi:CPA_1a_G0023390.mRNA.1.CDS.1 [Saccharomyces cerevisiae]|nr:CPA_1a_G0023390.mRNA.1.CDS.1 [Saccharomyces cerevisiae]CAI4509081.1 BBM_1a_G0023100.mRNA.1.CDS.1 [Saccharomyces cerevisiae]CAI7143476.1 BBM_1a_G0023100.mRNA.1.CDS.1 [Saccharomyces cerevisiae]CAI7326851.1 CPA_1a_G0023390.mRNA.1.CDS.1 [Saccharomyces cerevisiae]
MKDKVNAVVMPPSDVDNNTNGFIRLINPQCQEEDFCTGNSLFQNDNECVKQQRDILNEQTAPFPIINDQCPTLDLSRSNDDLMLQNEIPLPENTNFQTVQLTPSSGDCSSFAMADNDRKDNDTYTDTNCFSKRKDISPSSRTPSVPHNEDTPEDSKAKKKAQNRAAQKAFRERKEARMKELQDKLLESERNRQSLLKEIEELRKVNTEINAENRLLLRSGNEKFPRDLIDDTNHKYSFPTKDEFFTSMVLKGKLNNKGMYSLKDNEVMMKQNTQYTDEAGRQVLTVPATWEYLYKLSEERDFDVTYVMSKLQGQECCHTHGPAYPRNLIDFLVEEAALNE